MNNIRLFLSIVILSLCSVFSLQAQNFGGFPNNINWLQIETPHVRVIFPAGLSDKANRVASDIEYLINQQQTKLDFKLRKIDIVVNNQTVESNGYVAPAPYHSMFFLTPPQDANMVGAQDWLDGLGIHEYRHVWQLNQMYSKVCNMMYVLMGDRGWGGYLDVVFPNWYFEGDAVLSETKFTNSGRGRVPYFSLTERAMSLDSVKYKYIKVRNGSYKDALPNHYQFGYNLLAYGQKKMGEEGWRRVVGKAANLSGIIYPFSHAIRKETGHGTRALYDSMRVDFSKYTLEKNADRQVTPSTKITKPSKTVTNYYQSIFETDSTLLVMKNSYKEILSIYRFNFKTGIEKRICEVGRLDNPWFSYANGLLVWSEFRTDGRRWNKGYSIIKKMNLKTLFQRELTKETNYFSPTLSPDCRKIAVVEFSPDQQCTIKIIDPLRGNEIDTLLNSQALGDSVFASSPTFSQDGSSLIFILKKKDKLALFEYSFNTDQLSQLTAYSSNTISNPTVNGNKVFFSSSIGGQDDIFYVNREDKSVHRVTTSRVGAYFPAISSDGKQLVFSNYTLKGFDLQQMSLPETAEQVSVIKEPIHERYYGSEIYTEPYNLTDTVQTITYIAKKYNRVGSMINVHSWGPTANEYETGVELYSDNVLNNFSMLGGMYYNYNTNLSYARASLYYGGLYPVLYGGYTKVFDPLYKFQIMEGGAILPIDNSTAVYGKSFIFQLGYLNQQITTEDALVYNFGGAHISVTYQNFKYPAKQQVAPRKGIYLSMDWKNGFMNDNFHPAREIILKSNIYLPGFAKTNAIKLQFAQKVNTYDGYFMDQMDYPRGYDRPDSLCASYGKVGVNYQLPLCYPEFGVNGIFYLKRIRLNLFGDLGKATLYNTANGNYYGQNFRSVGAELYFDISWGNALEIPFFVRYSYCFDPTNRTIPFEFGTPVITF